MGILLSIIVLGLVIAIHEAGHFLVAKWCKVGVLEYALGFGKVIFSKRFGDTRYSLRAVPLGGYVRMAGDDPRALHEPKVEESNVDTNVNTKVGSPESWAQGELDDIDRRVMADRSGWFLNKPVWAKMAIVLAGPGANLISAVLIAIFTLWMFGATVPLDLPLIGQVLPGYPAEKAGLKQGDKVISIDGKQLVTWSDLSSTVLNSGGKEMTLSIERQDENHNPSVSEIKITGIQDKGEIAFLEGADAKPGFKIGIGYAGKREQVTFTEAVSYAFQHIERLSIVTLRGIGGLILGKISLKNIGGPIFIFGETMRSAAAGFADLMEFVVFLSVSLAVLNLLPVPVLDGGHLLFFAVEGLKGSPVSLRIHELANQVGMVLLLALTALAVGNDVLRLVHAF